MHRAATRRVVLCALVVLMLAGVPMAQAAVQELPLRQNILDTVAVLRLLYKYQLDYQSRIKLINHNTTLTLAQVETIDKLILSETREDGTDIGRFLGYAHTYQELLEQLRQFGYKDFLETLKTAKTTVETAASYAEKQGAAIEAAKDAEALETYKRQLKNLKDEVAAMDGRITRFASASGQVDYIKVYNDRLSALRDESKQFDAILSARMAEYKALFGQEVPVDTDYKSSAERFFPMDATPGLLVID